MPSRRSRRAIDLEVSEVFDKDSSDSENEIEKKKTEKKKEKSKPVEDIPDEVI